jgi:uncharacterized oxidoreductase
MFTWEDLVKLENHVVFVTGGGSGIGLALAAALAAKNNTVIISGRSAERLAEAKQKHPALRTVVCDVTNTAQVKAALDAIVKEHGRLSILVNNAGILNAVDCVKDGDAHFDAIDREIATNYTAPIKMTLLALPALMAQPQAAVINVTSGLAYTPIAKFAVYCGTKAALHSFSKSLRHQLEHTHVKVFDVLPPGTATELVHDLHGKTIPVDKVVTDAIRGIEKDHWEIPIGQSKVLAIMERIAPGFIEQQLLRAEDDPKI